MPRSHIFRPANMPNLTPEIRRERQQREGYCCNKVSGGPRGFARGLMSRSLDGSIRPSNGSATPSSGP
jgi:hypothetical protein